MHDVAQNFTFCTPTKVLFGKGSLKNLPQEISRFGKNVLLAYGGGSIKKTGLYDEIKSVLSDFNIFELSGIEPNPRVTSARKGIEMCREHKIDVVLAAGGGSVVDCCKLICADACSDTDAWDIVLQGGATITRALPLCTVLTLSATGSEFDCSAVISNLDTDEKLPFASPLVYPAVSVCDPTYTFTVSKKQTAAGSSDIMSHIFEQYFVDGTNMVSEGLCEGILRTVIKFAPIAYENPEDYTARGNLMWASSLACNGICALGSDPGAWVCHGIEHELSAYYDITHGEGLAILTPVLMRYTLCEKTVKRYAFFAHRVFGIPMESDLFVTASKGIEALEAFYAKLHLPRTLREVGITEKTHFKAMAEHACKYFAIDKAFYPLTPAQVEEVLNQAF